MIGRMPDEAGLPKGRSMWSRMRPRMRRRSSSAWSSIPGCDASISPARHVSGEIVAGLAAPHLKPVLLELGGKAPLVVLDDADIDGAVNAAAFGSYMNQGQICMSTERIIVDEKVADMFVEKLAEKARNLPCGDPRDQVVLGSMATSRTADPGQA